MAPLVLPDFAAHIVRFTNNTSSAWHAKSVAIAGSGEAPTSGMLPQGLSPDRGRLAQPVFTVSSMLDVAQ